MSRLAALVLVLWSGTAAAGRGGRVQRVERPGSNASVAPRMCELRGEVGTCIGEEPRTGQTMIVLDDKRVIGELQILEASTIVASCAKLWTVRVRAPHGASTDGVGVIDASINRGRARVVDKDHLPGPPSGHSGEEVWRAVDRDGDGTADILITRYSCDASGKPMPGGTTYCIDVWSRIAMKLTRTTQLNLAQCNI